MNIYVASSWRNDYQPVVVDLLRRDGHDVYDFREPHTTFHWSDIMDDWEDATPEDFKYVLARSHTAQRAFDRDMEHLMNADACVMVTPCGRSAHLELGCAVGAGKRTAVLLRDGWEIELMHKMAQQLFTNMADLRQWLRGRGEGVGF